MVPGYHYVLFAILLITFIGAVRSVVVSVGNQNLDGAILLVAVIVGLTLSAYFSREFSLKAPDRAIVAEENLRIFVRTGSLLDSALTVRQIIGLRFASDEEYDDLASDAVRNGTSEDDIKKSIKNWKPDTYRV